jgi:hypothetical protein
VNPVGVSKPFADFDLLPIGAGLALITGGLSLAIPFLSGLALAIASIAFAAWLIGTRPRPNESLRFQRNRPSRGWFWFSIAFFVVALILYFGAPPSIVEIRGLVIAVPPVSFWWSSTLPASRASAR